MTQIAISQQNLFNRSKYGIWGTLGNGGNCEVHFLQTVLTGDDIDNVKKISDIPESQKWPVKDLFQRNVNTKRVNESIIPYLNDDSKVKFFNPLTLIILPHDSSNKIIKDVPLLADNHFNDIGLNFESKEKEGFYRFGMSLQPFFGKVEWNTNNCYMVAIDGQHRLSALKDIKANPNNTFKDWKIPAVILIIHKTDNTKTADLLEIVRRLFIDINEKSERLSPTRKIILNDSLPVDILCQEIVEFSHSKTGNDILPLHFFDWRGDRELNQTPVTNIISVVELSGWFTSYFDFSSENSKNFKLPEWLLTLGIPKGQLNYANALKLREKLKKEFVPAFHKYFSSLEYVNNYFKKIQDTFDKTELSYFLEKEKYGTCQTTNLNLEVRYVDFFRKIMTDGKDAVREKSIPKYLQLEIGLRGVAYCFSQFNFFKTIYEAKYPNKSGTYTWSLHAEFVSGLVNKIINEKWFDEKSTTQQKNILRNLIYASNDGIINYRYESVEKGLGSLMLLLAVKYAKVSYDKPEIEPLILNLFDSIQDAYKVDIKKETKSNLIATFTGNQNSLRNAIEKEALSKLTIKIKQLRKYLDGI